ncbi:Hypothetical protein FKW44_012972 [Caligus rogercresseyi]|uniref:Uncharacterized protein n=1 Tax=Caligus rogercresseyi TaxID=217165 RepID=A0A7T8K9X9_CALRO|nr:Hypothetical protein FKW44_012972 [Caligus rogercresseyi]
MAGCRGGDCGGAHHTRDTADEDDDDEAEAAAPGPSISAQIEATDTLLAQEDHGVLCMVKNYELLQIIRFELMREVQQRKTQTKISRLAPPQPRRGLGQSLRPAVFL